MGFSRGTPNEGWIQGHALGRTDLLCLTKVRGGGDRSHCGVLPLLEIWTAGAIDKERAAIASVLVATNVPGNNVPGNKVQARNGKMTERAIAREQPSDSP